MNAIIAALGGIRASVFAALMLVFAGLFAWKAWSKHTLESEFSDAKSEWEKHSLAQAEAVISAQERVRQQEQASQAMVNRIVADYEREKRNAQVKANRVVADLSAGTLKLRQQWQACSSTNNLPKTSGDSIQPDSQDRLRAAGIGRILGIVSSCQAQRDGLIRVVEEDRR